MFKCIRGNESKFFTEESPLRQTTTHGFPQRPSALAWDAKLRLLAIGTEDGFIRIYGAAGVEFKEKDEIGTGWSHYSKARGNIKELFFLTGQGRIISHCDDSSLHLFELSEKEGGWSFEKVKSYNEINAIGQACYDITADVESEDTPSTALRHTVTAGDASDGRSRCVTSPGLRPPKCFLHSRSKYMLFGSANKERMSYLDVESFDVTQTFDRQEIVPSDCAEKLGHVVSFAEHPLQPSIILIGYKNGVVVIWDSKAKTTKNYFVYDQEVESLSWHGSGRRFISSHIDGSYTISRARNATEINQSSVTQYGPFPCKVITKILWGTVKKKGDFKIFSGGMPRACFGDKHTISVVCGEKRQVLDFTSRVVDFFTICHEEEQKSSDHKFRMRYLHSLVVLTEEELVAIDLEEEEWLPYRLPYLWSVHASPVTCTQHCGDVPHDLWNEIIAAGNERARGRYTDKNWPIDGGKNLLDEPSTRDLLLTGHEDGSVRFWDASGVALAHLYTIHTSNLFFDSEGESLPADIEKPTIPFRKVGSFDPYSDDPRLAVRKILLCVHSKTLVVAGTAGQIVFFELKEDSTTKAPEVHSVDIVSEEWKAWDKLCLRTANLRFEAGFVPFCIEQLNPPETVIALSAHTDWGLVAAGTAHGFALFDYIQGKLVMAKCTLHTNDESPKRKSSSGSWRKSFRRALPIYAKDRRQRYPAPKIRKRSTTRNQEVAAKGAMVRCLYMAESYIIDDETQSKILWVGTCDGSVYAYTISMDIGSRKSKLVTCQLSRSFQLRHRSPVVFIQILDSLFRPLLPAHETSPDTFKGPHSIMICTEEQFRVYTLPSMKPYSKLKLAAGEKARKVATVHLEIQHYAGHFLTCLLKEGEIGVFGIPELSREQKRCSMGLKENGATSSLVFTKTGQGFFLRSSSELQRFTLTPKGHLKVDCKVNFPSLEDDDDDENGFPDFFSPLPTRLFAKMGSLSEREEFIASLVYECSQEALEDILDCDLLTFEEGFEATEENLSKIIDTFEESERARRNFQQYFSQWRESRRRTISKLRELADGINSDRLNCNIAKLTGSSVGVIGGIGFALSPIFPPAAIVGIAASAAGGCTVLGTSATELGLLGTKMKEAKVLLQRDAEQFKPMARWLKQSNKIIELMDDIVGFEVAQKIWEGLMKLKGDLSSSSNEEGYSPKLQQLLLHCIEGCGVAGLIAEVSLKVIPIVVSFLSIIVLFRKDNALLFNCVVLTHRAVMTLVHVLKLEATIGNIVCKAVTKGGKAVAHGTATIVARSVLAGVGIALDVTNIVFDSIDVHKGSISEQAVQLKKAADQLEKELKIVEDIYIALS